MLAQVARQILYCEAQLEKLAYALVAQVETGIAELALQRVTGILVLP